MGSEIFVNACAPDHYLGLGKQLLRGQELPRLTAARLLLTGPLNGSPTWFEVAIIRSDDDNVSEVERSLPVDLYREGLDRSLEERDAGQFLKGLYPMG